MASTLTVDNIVGATSSSNIHIPGSVVQIQSSSNGDSWSTTSGSYVTITDMTVTITPKFSTSKLYVFGHVSGAGTNNSRPSVFRDGTNMITTVTSRTPAIADFYENLWDGVIHVRPFNFYVNANSTSSTTFDVRVFTTGTFFLNKARDTTDNSGRTNGHSTITVMEIAQ
jgi:hypothetical protein